MFFNDRQKHNQRAPLHAAKKLIRLICEQQPVSISISKLCEIKNQIKLIEFAWILAICESRYDTFGSVDQDTKSLYEKLSDSAEYYISLLEQEIMKLLPEQVEKITPWYPADTSKLSFKVAPQILITLLISGEELKHIVNLEKSAKKTQSFDVNEIIDKTLKTDIGLLIKNAFPHYKGSLATKTSAPHRLIIKIMIIMREIGRQDITWIPIKQFIEEHISGNHDRETLANLDEINDNFLTVSGVPLSKTNATGKIGDYKRKFKIK